MHQISVHARLRLECALTCVLRLVVAGCCGRLATARSRWRLAARALVEPLLKRQRWAAWLTCALADRRELGMQPGCGFMRVERGIDPQLRLAFQPQQFILVAHGGDLSEQPGERRL